jgi:hypothetical protein
LKSSRNVNVSRWMSDAKLTFTHPRKARNTQLVKDPKRTSRPRSEAFARQSESRGFCRRRRFRRHPHDTDTRGGVKFWGGKIGKSSLAPRFERRVGPERHRV